LVSKRKTASVITLILLLTSLLAVAFNIQPVRGSGTIYIRANGSIDPPTANITTTDNVTYTFIGNNHDSIVVERDNIVVDGAGYVTQGIGNGVGINVSDRNNIIIKLMKIKSFEHGIFLEDCFNISISENNITENSKRGIWAWYSSDIEISGNIISDNTQDGIGLGSYSSNNTIFGNTMTDNGFALSLGGSLSNSIYENNIVENRHFGIGLYESSNNRIYENNIRDNGQTNIGLGNSFNNTIHGNNLTKAIFGLSIGYSNGNIVTCNQISGNLQGVKLTSSFNNSFCHNNFVDNTEQVNSLNSTSVWDNGYPSGGNYWSDYLRKYLNATEIDGSRIWDTPYVIDEDNIDHYPLIPEFSSLIILPLLMTLTLLAALVQKKKSGKTHKTGSCPGQENSLSTQA